MNPRTLAKLEEVRERLEEATTAMVPKALRTTINMLDDKLKPRAKKYGATLQVTGLAKGIEVRAWIDTDQEEEARDVAKALLGSGYSIEPHKLKKNYWVAETMYTLADIF